MDVSSWIRANCRFAATNPAQQLVDLLKAKDYRAAAQFLFSIPENERGQVRADCIRIIQSEEGGFSAYLKGMDKLTDIDWRAFQAEIDMLYNGWGEAK